MPSPSARPVVVGVDGSESALTAVRWAARAAHLRSASLHLVHAMSSGWDLGRGGVVALQSPAMHKQGQAALSVATSVAVESAPGLAVHSDLVSPSPLSALRRRAREAELLVVGTRGLGAFERALLGSVSRALARHPVCPLAVVPAANHLAGTHLPVLVGIDGSPASGRALEIAIEEASRRRVGLEAIYIWSEPEPGIQHAHMPEHARQMLSQALTGYREKYPEVAITTHVAEDDPAQRLLEESRRAQLIVLGSHGRGRLTGHVLGSVSRAVLYATQIPLILVGRRI
ncbi:universal stress protein [Nocardia sp. NPDC057663]|uniref:universal stress protein n=1 Tax=Nocardia sp. NPDC057663 TaxID=3346201 RepID=UPI0036731A22